METPNLTPNKQNKTLVSSCCAPPPPQPTSSLVISTPCKSTSWDESPPPSPASFAEAMALSKLSATSSSYKSIQASASASASAIITPPVKKRKKKALKGGKAKGEGPKNTRRGGQGMARRQQQRVTLEMLRQESGERGRGREVKGIHASIHCSGDSNSLIVP